MSARARVAITFDCWGTLLYEPEPGVAYSLRVEAVARAAARLGLDDEPAAARAALDAAWRRHWELWRQGVASGAPEMAGWALEALASSRRAVGVPASTVRRLAMELAEASLDAEVLALEGAVATLAAVSRAGLRRALICDTGFSSGAVVRRLLARADLLEHLEVAVFSDEVGTPKPDPRAFRAALEPLGLGGAGAASAAVHIGDLRRTDVAGGRGAGMATVRIRAHYDDTTDLAEADRVADSHAHLLEILELP